MVIDANWVEISTFITYWYNLIVNTIVNFWEEWWPVVVAWATFFWDTFSAMFVGDLAFPDLLMGVINGTLQYPGNDYVPPDPAAAETPKEGETKTEGDSTG